MTPMTAVAEKHELPIRQVSSLHTDTEALRGLTKEVVSSMAKADYFLKIRAKLAHQAYARAGFAPECQTT